MDTDDPITDKGRLLFGAGFVFGVMFTMLLLAVVLVATTGSGNVSLATQPVMLTILAGIVFAGIVGVGLYFLAFPENRTKIPVEPDQFETPGRTAADGDEETDGD